MDVLDSENELVIELRYSMKSSDFVEVIYCLLVWLNRLICKLVISMSLVCAHRTPQFLILRRVQDRCNSCPEIPYDMQLHSAL